MCSEIAAVNTMKLNRELGTFLEGSLGLPDMAWPRLQRIPPAGARHMKSGSCSGLRVLVVGELSLGLDVHIEASKAEVEEVLRGRSARSFRWTMSQLSVGGFAGYVAPVAAALGAQVFVCTVIPVPLPRRLRMFLDCYGIDDRYMTAWPGQCPLVTRFWCRDGEVFATRRTGSLPAIKLPHIDAGVDVILVDSASVAHDSNAFCEFARGNRRDSGRTVVGLRATHTLGRNERELARQEQVWTFLRHSELPEFAARFAGAEAAVGDEALLTCLQERSVIGKLVVQLGARGAVLLNGLPCPYYVHSCPLASKRNGSPGETLLAVTTLSSASGADERICLRRGVAAATGIVAGLDTPTSFEELDVA